MASSSGLNRMRLQYMQTSLDDRFVIRDTRDNKGLGVFANVDLPAGTLLVREDPVIRHRDYDEGFDVRQLPDVVNQYDSLRRAVQLEVRTLAGKAMVGEDEDGLFDYFQNTFTRPNGEQLDFAKASEYSWMVQVLFSNCLGFRNEAGEDQAGLYLLTSRFNHACSPNILANIKTNGESTLRTRRRVLKGEELTMPYIPLNLSRRERKAMLESEFGFECLCDLCDEEDLQQGAAFHEYRIAELFDMDDTMKYWTRNEFSTLPFEDVAQLLNRFQTRLQHYLGLYWVDMAYYELLNICDLQARLFMLSPADNSPMSVQRRAVLADTWKNSMTQAVHVLGPVALDADDEHLTDPQRALARFWVTGVPPIIDPEMAAEDYGTPTIYGRRRRSRTKSVDPPGAEAMGVGSPGYRTS